MKKNWSKRLFLSITGDTEKEWRDKLNEINNLGLDTVALFLECYHKRQRALIYEALVNSSIKHIPLIHIRNDMDREEIAYLSDKYNKPYLTVHEDSFKIMEKWCGFYKQLYLEFNYDDYISNDVKVKRIGGFCVDLAHFKVAEEKWSKEFEYTLQRRCKSNLFACNHLSGYSFKQNTDEHYPDSPKYFDYLKTLPDFVFGEVIAIEVFKSIKQQIEYKKYILKILNSRKI
jgi:hypothetical protein